MRRRLVLVLACAVVALLWVARTPPTRTAPDLVAAVEEEGREPITKLAAPPAVDDDGVGDAAQPTSARHASPRDPRKAPPEALRAPVRGRLVVAETGDPIEVALSLRLRTIDLRMTESLVTTPVGTFASRTSFPRARLLALLKDGEGRELVDHEALFEPAAEDEWLVLVPDASWPTFATGRVLDRRGAPLAGVQAFLVGHGAEMPFAQARSDEEGTLELHGLRKGLYRLLLQGSWSRAESDVVLRTGANTLGDLVLDEPACADLRVHVVLEDPAKPPDAWFELRDAGHGRQRRFPASDAVREEDGSYTIRLGAVPNGRYELTTHAFDGRTYEPARVSVSPPGTVELRASGTPGGGTLFRARDARTGEPLHGFSVFGRYGRTWGIHQAQAWRREGRRQYQELLEEVRLRAGYDSWVVCATGYRAAAGTFAGAGDTITVALEPGWSELFQFEDAEGDVTGPRGHEGVQDPPVLAGVELFVDGQPAGTADAQGFFLLHAESEPDAIEFRLAGWRVVDEDYLGSLHTVVLAPTR